MIRPESSIERPEDIGRRAHTNVEIMIAPGGLAQQRPDAVIQPAGSPPYSGLGYETPASLACVYHLVTPSGGACNPNTVTAIPTGGSRAIGIVDAYDDPTAAADASTFSSQFGLAAPSVTRVFATSANCNDDCECAPPSSNFCAGSQPSQDPDGGWEFEESLDVQWAHAMAPKAKIILVEAATSCLGDLLTAEACAASRVSAAGGGEVSNSWGSGEFLGETGLDTYFTESGIVYFASAGDGPGVIWPSSSPNVVSAGGTSTSRNPSTLAYLNKETTWQVAGGGFSPYEPRPAFQDSVSSIVGTQRGTPDLSFDANPMTGVWIYDGSPPSGMRAAWWVVGGTSVSSPSLAGIVNAAGEFSASSQVENTLIYSNKAVAADFHDITIGDCGPYGGYFATTGWNMCSGVGSVLGLAGK